VVVLLENTFEMTAMLAKKRNPTAPMIRVLGGCTNRREFDRGRLLRRFFATHPMTIAIKMPQIVH
jgi:hypothetical protein